MREWNFDRWDRLIRTGIDSFDVDLTAEHVRQYYRHAQELRSWSQRINLTTITAPGEMAIKHFVDSIAPVQFLAPMQSVLDVGSGAGFPGLPLKVLCPHIELTMIDAVRKKTSFLRQVTRLLKLTNVTVIHGRMEGLENKRYDTIISRAFGHLSFIISHALPLLSAQGQIAVWKGHMPAKEIAAARPLLKKASRPMALSTNAYQLPIVHADRTLIRIHPIATP